MSVAANSALPSAMGTATFFPLSSSIEPTSAAREQMHLFAIQAGHVNEPRLQIATQRLAHFFIVQHV